MSSAFSSEAPSAPTKAANLYLSLIYICSLCWDINLPGNHGYFSSHAGLLLFICIHSGNSCYVWGIFIYLFYLLGTKTKTFAWFSSVLAPPWQLSWVLGANAEVQLSQREKSLCSHFSSAPPWHLQTILFKEFSSLWQLQSCLPFSLAGPTKGTRDFSSMQDTLSTQTLFFPSQS